MSYFFFYKNFTDVELITKISKSVDIYDGYVLVESYDKENNIMKINKLSSENNILLNGKICKFNMRFEDVLKKINDIRYCRFKNNNNKCKLDNVWAYKSNDEPVHVNIIY